MKKQFYTRLLLPLLLCLLAGCIPVIVAAVAATAGGAIIYDKRPSEVILQDQDISNRALNALNSDPQLQGVARVAVATFNHVVLIVGQTESEALRARAYADVRRVPNVKRVYNQMQISPILTTRDRGEDAWITSKVKTAMLAKRGLSSSQIKVVTENKVVYLMGLVTPGQAELATDVARHVTGVQKVVQVFEYET